MNSAAAAGDVVVVESLETLFRLHYARLVRALAVVSGSQESAADAVQEAFVKAHLHWRKTQDSAPVPKVGSWPNSEVRKCLLLPRFPQQTRMIWSLSQKKPEQEGDPCSGVRSASRT